MNSYDTLFSSGSSTSALDYGVIHGNSVDMNIQKDDSEIRADIVVSRVNNIRIWGQVKDGEGVPISMALVKLIKPINSNGVVGYQGVAHTLTDCSGFYQLEVPANAIDNKYKIIVSKASLDGERVISATSACGCGCGCSTSNCSPPPPPSTCMPCTPCAPSPCAAPPPPPPKCEPCTPCTPPPPPPQYAQQPQCPPAHSSTQASNIGQYSLGTPVSPFSTSEPSIQYSTSDPVDQYGNSIGQYSTSEPVHQYSSNDTIGQYQASDSIEHVSSYTPEPINNSFYGEPLNKSNIFKKNE